MNVSAISAGTTGSPLLQSGSQASPSSADSSNSNAKNTSAGSAVVISLSATATSLLGAPTQKDFATVAADARATLNAGYQALGKTGDIYTTASDWKQAFGNMDRRSLYAVASNEGGQFSTAEQGAASFFMAKQQSDAMTAANPAGTDDAAGYKAMVTFLDGVSPEEKATFGWAEQRATTQWGYEQAMRSDGKEPEKLDSTNPLVKMIMSAMNALQATGDPSKKLEDMPQYRQAVVSYSAQGSDGSVNITA